jgi:hypothetical protein
MSSVETQRDVLYEVTLTILRTEVVICALISLNCHH